jgi:transposase-like protein
LHSHGTVPKSIKDLGLDRVIARRYLCTRCKRSFRYYPDGIDNHDQSKRLRALAAILWGLGLSHNSVSQILAALGSAIAKMTSWRDVQEAATNIRKRPPATGSVAVIGVDETFPKVKGKKMTVGFVVDPESGELLGIDLLLEQDQIEFLKWLRGYVARLGVAVVVSDDLSTYKPVVEALAVEHQVCLAHVKKNVVKRLGKVAGMAAEKEKLKVLMEELPLDGGKRLLELEPRVRGEPKLRELVIALIEKWRSLVCYKRIDGVPRTNNGTEQVIGRSKIRYKTMRGYKSIAGMLNGLYITQWVWRPGAARDAALLTAA